MAAQAPPPTAAARKRRQSSARSRPLAADATAFCPQRFTAGESELVQIVVHPKGQRAAAHAAAREADARTFFAAPSRGLGELDIGDSISIHLDVRGAKVDDPPETQIWSGDMLRFGFGVTSNGQTRNVAVNAIISINGISIGRISFTRPVARIFSLSDLVAIFSKPRLSRYQRAFFSYARTDREIVKKIAAEYEKYGVSFFQDILDLDPGERWERRLYTEIDRCDVFVLFWSSAASSSEWVVKEAERAWRRQARTGGRIPSLKPEILEHPSPKPEQGWLAEFHLDDRKFYRQ